MSSSSILRQATPRGSTPISNARKNDVPFARVVPNVKRSVNSEFPGVSLVSSKPITRIVTSKKWVLPPRPKPGRKPSVDVPTTKRKAQNRAAQRAFRERRANRVTELEKQLMELEREKSIKEGVLTNVIKTVQVENSHLKEVIESLNQKVGQMSKQMELLTDAQTAQEKVIQKQKIGLRQFRRDLKAKDLALLKMANSRVSNQSVIESPDSSRKRRKVSKKSPEHSSKDVEVAEAASTMIRFKNSGSASEESGNGLSSSSLSDVLKSFKPMAPVPLKARKRTPSDQTGFKEIDFTGMFKSHQKIAPNPLGPSLQVPSSRPNLAASNTLNSTLPAKIDETYSQAAVNTDFEESVISPDEKCGFCSEDSPCLCREIAHQKHDSLDGGSVMRSSRDMSQSTSRSDSVSIAQTSAASSVSTELVDVQRADKQASICTGNPGSCPQCMNDPMSSLFCTTLAKTSKAGAAQTEKQVPKVAASRTILPAPKFLDGQRTTKMEHGRLPSLEELELENPGRHYIPCSDAYRKLSKHSNFRRERMGNIINNLNTSGMFVEVESIGKCLHLLDREFGNN